MSADWQKAAALNAGWSIGRHGKWRHPESTATYVNNARAFRYICEDHGLQPTRPDPRDPDPTRPGIFRGHNCGYCRDGKLPCRQGAPERCEYPHARND